MAFIAWAGLCWDDYDQVGTSNHLVVFLSALALGHAWKWIPFGRRPSITSFWEAFYALGTVAVLAGWWLPDSDPERMVGLGVMLSLLLLGYGAFTRAAFLAGFGQIFLWIAVGFSIDLDPNNSWSWAWALLPIFELVAVRRGVPWFLAFFGWEKPSMKLTLAWLGKPYAFASLILGWIWLERYIPVGWKIPAYLSAGFLLFLAGTFLSAAPRSLEDNLLLVFSGLFAAVGWGYFMFDGLPSLQNGLFLLLIPLAEAVGRRRETIPPSGRMILVAGGVLAFLFFVTRFTDLHLSDNYWTVSWGLLAGVVFAAGFVLKHSWYRWAGLALLALAIGRVGVVDIWRFQTIYRILSLFVLSGMAIGLGFLYTRYQEKMKEWL